MLGMKGTTGGEREESVYGPVRAFALIPGSWWTRTWVAMVGTQVGGWEQAARARGLGAAGVKAMAEARLEQEVTKECWKIAYEQRIGQKAEREGRKKDQERKRREQAKQAKQERERKKKQDKKDGKDEKDVAGGLGDGQC